MSCRFGISRGRRRKGMTWCKIDDGFEDHSKVEPLSDAAHRLWMRALCWSNKEQNEHTRGFLPRKLLPTIAKRSASTRRLENLARELVEADGAEQFDVGLWEPVEEKGKLVGWQIHDWHKYRPKGRETPADPGELSGKRSAAGRKGAEARWGKGRQDDSKPEHLPSHGNGKPMANAMAIEKQIDAPVPGPVPEEDPPYPPDGKRPGRPKDPLGDSLRRQAPGDRQDVRAVFEAFKAAVGLSGLRFRSSNDLQAVQIAEAIDAHGLDDCLLVAGECPHDGMVSGKADERGQAHKSVRYVFENPDTFARVLTAAKAKRRKERGRKGIDAGMAAAMAADAEGDDDAA